MEEDHDFSEFEAIKTTYRRALLPWWIWAMLLLYAGFNALYLISDVYSLLNGYVFVYDMLRANVLIPYPYYPMLSVFLYLFMLITVFLLWLEKKKAATIGLWCFGLLLALCAAILAKGLLTGHFYLRIEMIIFIDLVLRLYDLRTEWETQAISRKKIADIK
ncbi:hypothetical protein ACLI09_00345 [Flavobacterium sp. RHBU_24]|uniref:hypothetical protein n=1 Tax=Flavobacterium sp. RHBU_24 TaxID=3391185 RepID=UPI00398500AC